MIDPAAPTTVAIIQVRMASTRLPGKALLQLAGAPLLQRLIERVLRSRRIDRLIVATTDEPSDDPVANLCEGLDIRCHRGSRLDVLQRVIDAARSANADVVVRLTGDNPFIDGELIDSILAQFLANSPPCVYAHNVESSGFPYGLFVEVATLAALEQAATSSDPEDHEHVTLFLRRNPQLFPGLAVQAPGPFSVDSVTVDTADQYHGVRDLFERLYRTNPRFGFDALLSNADTSSQAQPRATGTK